MVILQSEAQLRSIYAEKACTIIDNCDSYVYLGGNDLHTMENMSRKVNKPLKDILSMPYGKCIVFRCGSKPVEAQIYQPGEYEQQLIYERERAI